MEEFKKCSKCGTEKPCTDDYFRKHIHGRHGFRSICRDCDKTIQKEWRKNHPDYYVRYHYDDGYDKQKRELYNKKYQEANKERLAARRKEYRELNREKINKSNNLYRINNTDRVNLLIQRYHAKKKGLSNDFSKEQWNDCKNYFNCYCAYCGNKKPLTMDHFIPVSAGGELTINNVLPVCKPCNSSKNAKGFFEWYPRQAFYSKARERKILKYLNYDPETKTQQLALSI